MGVPPFMESSISSNTIYSTCLNTSQQVLHRVFCHENVNSRKMSRSAGLEVSVHIHLRLPQREKIGNKSVKLSKASNMCESTWSQVKQFEEHYDDVWHNYDIPPHATESHCTCCMRRPSWVRKNCIGHRQSKSLRMLLVKQRPRPAQLEHPLTARIGMAQDDPFHLPPSMEPALCSKSTWPSLNLSIIISNLSNIWRCLIFGLLWTLPRHMAVCQNLVPLVNIK